MSFKHAKICLIQSDWHSNIVGEFSKTFLSKSEEYGIKRKNIDLVTVPGALEIPLQAQLRAKTGKYDIIVATGLIVNGGIYRHEFVAQAVIDGCMKAQLETQIPIIHSVMTPINFHENQDHHNFFFRHLSIKGEEAFSSMIMTLKNIQEVEQIK